VLFYLYTRLWGNFSRLKPDLQYTVFETKHPVSNTPGREESAPERCYLEHIIQLCLHIPHLALY